MRAGICDGLDDIRDCRPDLQGLIPIEHPQCPVNLKIAGQYSEDISERTEGIPWSGLCIALTAGHEQLRVSFLRDASEFPHEAGLSAARVSQEKDRHGISGHSLLKVGLEPREFLLPFHKTGFGCIGIAILMQQEG